MIAFFRFLHLLRRGLPALLLIAARPVAAQLPAWQWAVSAPTTIGYANCTATALDSTGHIIVAGVFTGSISFGATTLTSAGGLDIYVARMSPAGQWQWAVSTTGGAAYGDVLNGLAVDSRGNAYVTGSYASPSVSFGATTLTNSNALPNDEAYLAKVSPNGVWRWAVKAGGARFDEGYAVAVDAADRVLLAGYFNGPATFGPFTQAGGGASRNGFVARLDSAGTWQWVQAVQGAGDYVNAVAADSSGHVYVTGAFRAPRATFGATTLTNSAPIPPNALGTDLFIARLDTGGAWEWAVSASGASSDEGQAVAVAPDGAVLVTGYVYGPAQFGPFNFPGAGTEDVFVAKLTPAGTWQWVATAGGSRNDRGLTLAVDASGDAYVAGLFLASAQFGTNALTSQGSFDPFVAKLSRTGTWQWASSVGGTGSDRIKTLALDRRGRLVVSGDFSSPTITFGPVTLSYTAQSSQMASIFVASTQLPLGVPGEFGGSRGLLVSPNPATGSVRVLPPADAPVLELFDGLGRRVRQQTLAGDTRAVELNLRELPGGVYTIRAGGLTRRLVVNTH